VTDISRRNTGPENYSQRRGPWNTFAQNDRVSEERVDAHAGRNRKRQASHTRPSSKRHRETDNDRCRQHAAEGHPRFSVGRNNRGLTTTMYAIVKNVVMPAMASVLSLPLG
jgi:hypothetical protein